MKGAMSLSLYEGRLVRLRARELADAEANYRWINDHEVVRNIMMRYPSSMADQRKRLEDGPSPGFSAALFGIETLADDTYIGWCGLSSGSAEDRSAHLGIAIGDKGYWNGGYGTDAMRTLCRFGFESMNLHRIELGVFEENKRARRVYEKLGFQHEGQRRDADYREGSYRDVTLMGLLAGELRG